MQRPKMTSTRTTLNPNRRGAIHTREVSLRSCFAAHVHATWTAQISVSRHSKHSVESEAGTDRSTIGSYAGALWTLLLPNN